jgi:hypothetical protein
MKRSLIATLLPCAAVLLLPAAAPAQSEAGQARVTPWSGYWWPHRRGGVIRPLQKYGRFVGCQEAANWERKTHPSGGVEQWFGFCHAWSASAVMEPEPTRPRTVRLPGGGCLTLSVGDQKGLLAAAHAKDVANVFGHRSETNNQAAPEYIDLTPDQLWRYLKLYIKQQGVPLVMDLEAGRQVWNYPVYAYRIQYSGQGGNDYRGRITIWYAEDNVPADFVGTRVGTRTYYCTFKMRGGAVVAGSGRWVGPSVKDHPDFAWYPYVVRPENPHVDYAQVRQMLGQDSYHRSVDGDDKLDSASPPAVHRPRSADEPGPLTLTPTELMALVAARRSRFHLLVQTGDFNGVYKEGDAYKVSVLSEKPGYLYLLHLDRDGHVKVLFPMEGQDNRIPPGGKKVEFPRPGDDFQFVCDSVGPNRIKGVVTTRPLHFTGLDQSDDDPPKKKRGQGLPFFLNPQTEAQALAVLNGEVLRNDEARDRAVRDLQVDPGEVLGDCAHGEATFYVGH